MTYPSLIRYFNPRSDERSDICLDRSIVSGVYFNPRSDERSDKFSRLSPIRFLKFQSTLRRTELHYIIRKSSSNTNFNPRSDERSDHIIAPMKVMVNISIHAPTNGATSAYDCPFVRFHISIHAPTNGATRSRRCGVNCHDISIHAPTNGATSLTLSITSVILISIHAPTNGATTLQCEIVSIIQHFNPRSDERSDVLYETSGSKQYDFNPRSDERSDSPSSDSVYLATNFNPRSDERSDQQVGSNEHRTPISIHAPTNGATSCAATISNLLLFQSTLRRTERLCLCLGRAVICYFNPRSDERSDTFQDDGT